MILKKPYAILIKYFRLIHLFILFFSIYSIYNLNILLKFFNNYLTNQESVIGLNLQENLFSFFFFAVLIVLIIISLVLLWLMSKKKKPFRFYLYNFIICLLSLIFIIYVYSFLGKMTVSLVDILNVRIIRDLLIIFIGLHFVSSIITFIRTIGFDIKSFEFMKDLQQLEISQEDQEEYEIELNYDSNERKRKRKKYFRYLKYSYKENKIFINFIIIICFIMLSFFIFSKVNVYTITNKEGKNISTSYYDFNVEDSFLVSTNYRGIKITDNILIVIKLKIRSKGLSNKLILGNFKLRVGDDEFASTNNYDEQIFDIGKVYNNDYISDDYKEYLLVFEVPADKYKKDIKFIYYENGKSVKVKLNPSEISTKIKEYNLGEKIDISSDDQVVINNFEIGDKYILNYDFCLKDKCYNSVQYLVPSLDSNYEKAIIKINGSSIHQNGSNYKSFSNLISGMGYIEYNFYGDVRYSNLNIVSDVKQTEDDIYYFEINKQIMESDSFKLVFYTRNCKYVYNLK